MGENLKNIKCSSDSFIAPRTNLPQKNVQNEKMFQDSLDTLAIYTCSTFDVDTMFDDCEVTPRELALKEMDMEMDEEAELSKEASELSKQTAILNMQPKALTSINSTFKSQTVKGSIASDQIANISRLISSNAKNILMNKGTGDIVVKLNRTLPNLNGFDMLVNAKNNGEVFVSFTVSESNKNPIMEPGLDLVVHSVGDISRLLAAQNMVLASMSFAGQKLEIKEAISANEDRMAEYLDKEGDLDYDEERNG